MACELLGSAGSCLDSEVSEACECWFASRRPTKLLAEGSLKTVWKNRDMAVENSREHMSTR